MTPSTASGWSALVAATLRVPKSHILISAGDGEVAGIDGLPMPRVRPDALASAVRPAAQGVAIAKRIHRASRRAHGLPGRFVGLLWPQAAAKKRYVVRHRPILRAAEQPATYAAEDSNEAHAAICRVEREAWPAPAELSALRKRMESARRLIDRGRHAPGERLLRQAIGGFARRGEASHANEGLVLLASCLLKRGRANDARDAIADAATRWDLKMSDTAMVDAAIIAGQAWIDLARLDEAESVLGAALAGTRASHDRGEARVCRALARCAFWRGRYADARQLVQQAAPHDDESTVRANLLG